jgi:hypothetical protein
MGRGHAMLNIAHILHSAQCPGSLPFGSSAFTGISHCTFNTLGDIKANQFCSHGNQFSNP